MTKIVCVTTMNEVYYNKIGKLMLESWSAFWPKTCRLVVYQEGLFNIGSFKNIEIVNWHDNCYKDWKRFKEKAEEPAITFAKKGYTMISAMENIDCDLLIWCDADTVTIQNFPEEKILSILPNNKLIAFFDTFYQHFKPYDEEYYLDPKRTMTAAESGFVIINKNHEMFELYSQEYRKLYDQPVASKDVGPWYDGGVCAASAKNLRHFVEDLSKLTRKQKTQTPINHSWIGEYVRHKKAKQKNNIDIEEFKKTLGI